MNLLERIQSAKEDFTPTDRRIADAVINNPDDFTRLDTNTISGQYGFSQPALTRFAKKIGYAGYADFKYDIARNKNSLMKISEEETFSADTYRILNKTEEMFPKEELDRIVGILDGAERIFVTGFHRSRAMADLMNSALINSRYPSQSIAFDEVFKLDSFCRPDDLLIVFSVSSGIYDSFMKNLSQCRNKPETLLITCTEKHGAAGYFDHVIVLPDRKTVASSYSLDPAITNLFFINLLSMHMKTQD